MKNRILLMRPSGMNLPIHKESGSAIRPNKTTAKNGLRINSITKSYQKKGGRP